MLDQVPLNFVVKSKSVEIILLAVLNNYAIHKKKKTFHCKKKKKNYKRLKNVQDKDQDCTVSNHYQLDLSIPTYFKNYVDSYADRTKATLFGCVCFDLRN